MGLHEYLHLLAEAMKVAWADRTRTLGDPDFTKIPDDNAIALAIEQRHCTVRRKIPWIRPRIQ